MVRCEPVPEQTSESFPGPVSLTAHRACWNLPRSNSVKRPPGGIGPSSLVDFPHDACRNRNEGFSSITTVLGGTLSYKLTLAPITE